MKQFSPYDIPGAVLTNGIIALHPDTIKAIPNTNLSLGDLGVVVLVSHVMGNLAAGDPAETTMIAANGSFDPTMPFGSCVRTERIVTGGIVEQP